MNRPPHFDYTAKPVYAPSWRAILLSAAISWAGIFILAGVVYAVLKHFCK